MNPWELSPLDKEGKINIPFMPEFLPSEHDDQVFPELCSSLGNVIKNPNKENDFLGDLLMTKEDLKKVSKSEADEASLYDMSDEAANKVAKSRGLIVVYPKDNQIQIDIDGLLQYNEFKERLEKLFDAALDTDLYKISNIQEIPSTSGLPNRHIYITFQYKTFTPQERIWFQSVLGSDPMRELLDTKRLIGGMTDKPTRFFEKPEVAETLK